MRSKYETLKILAEAILKRHWEFQKRFQCIHCQEYDQKHKSDCPVLLAEEVLERL